MVSRGRVDSVFQRTRPRELRHAGVTPWPHGTPCAGDDTVASVINRNIGMLVLGLWLILTGLSGMVALGLPAMLMAVLALVAGILIIAGR